MRTSSIHFVIFCNSEIHSFFVNPKLENSSGYIGISPELLVYYKIDDSDDSYGLKMT